MGSLENRLRKKWQDYGGRLATSAENSFYEVLSDFFDGTDLIIEKKPSKFSNIYVNVPLDKQELSEIYIPPIPCETSWHHAGFRHPEQS